MKEISMRLLMRKGLNAVDELPVIITWWNKKKYILKVYEKPVEEEQLPKFRFDTFCDSCCRNRETLEIEITSLEGKRRLEVCRECLSELSTEAEYTTGMEINIVK